MKANEIRKKFLQYFSDNGHETVPSSGLIPHGDPTLLFTNAGMVQFKKVFLGEDKRPYSRAASCQKCMRAGGKHNDLENVGQTTRHHTFFEMLGNFSFGDYFKERAIEFAWELLTVEFKIPANKLWVTVYEEDFEAEKIWNEKIRVPKDRIKRLGEKDNFWSMGEGGPCGPCSEILIDQGAHVGCLKPTCGVGCDCDRFLEIWNLVFMQYDRNSKGELAPLPKPSIDTGMGLERISAVMQGKTSNYDTDLFAPIIRRIEELTDAEYGIKRESDVSIRAIADHSRVVPFLISEGIMPSNEGRGYVLRRVIRRAVRHGRFLGIKEPFLHKLVPAAIDAMKEAYPELARNSEIIIRATLGEEERFFETLERGLSILEQEVAGMKKSKTFVVPGSLAFKLYDTYGFPIDLTADIVKAEGIKVDEEGFITEMELQREKARKAWKGAAEDSGEGRKHLVEAGLKSSFVGYHMDVASSKVIYISKNGMVTDTAATGDEVDIVTEETPFYGESGGQSGDTGVIVGKGVTLKVIDTQKPFPELIVHACKVIDGTIKTGDAVELIPDKDKRRRTRGNHTATHILHALLRETLGKHVRQAGSLVTPKGLRFDFNHFESLSIEDIRSLEEKANKIVRANIKVSTEVLPYEKAVEKGALAFFGEKYGGIVRMVEVSGVSKELCGGTHAFSTGELGLVKITSESSVAAGVRRIEAITGEDALNAFIRSETILRESASLLKASFEEVTQKIKKLNEYQKELEKEIRTLRQGEKRGAADKLLNDVREIGGVKILATEVEVKNPLELRAMADAIRVKLGSGVVFLINENDGKVNALAAVTKNLTKRFSAGELIKRVAPIIGGRGGGKEDLAQAGGTVMGKTKEALQEAVKAIEEMSATIS
ncbi:MAG: alanine--tRNA ligase [Thermodesulfobacteriota bacterium]